MSSIICIYFLIRSFEILQFHMNETLQIPKISHSQEALCEKEN